MNLLSRTELTLQMYTTERRIQHDLTDSAVFNTGMLVSGAGPIRRFALIGLNFIKQKNTPMIQEFFSNAHWLQIIVSGVAFFAIGAVWYAPPVFGKMWQEGHKIEMTEESKKRVPMLFASTFVIGILMSIGIGLAMYVMQAPGTCMNGIKTGLFLSGVFTALPMGINYLYTGKPFKLWFIDAGYHVVGITLMSIIQSVWH